MSETRTILEASEWVGRVLPDNEMELRWETSAGFEEEIILDPYSTAAGYIKYVLERALDDGVSGRMNETEFHILDTLARTLGEMDPASAPEPRIG
jgi:hypothetical protein